MSGFRHPWKQRREIRTHMWRWAIGTPKRASLPKQIAQFELALQLDADRGDAHDRIANAFRKWRGTPAEYTQQQMTALKLRAFLRIQSCV